MKGERWHQKTTPTQPKLADVIKINVLPPKSANWKPPFRRKRKQQANR